MSESNNTPPENKKEKMRAFMAQIFPNAFFLVDEQIKPFKVGIREDILEGLEANTPETFKLEVLKFLGWYIKRKAYRRSLLNNAMRIDLKGNEVAPVSPEDKEHAQQVLDGEKQKRKILRKRQSKRKAKQREKEEKRKAKEQNKEQSQKKVADKPTIKQSKVAQTTVENVTESVNAVKPKLTLKKGKGKAKG